METVRALLNTGFVALATIVGSVLSLLSRIFDGTGDSVIRLARAWSLAVTRFSGVVIEVEQRAPLDASQPYVFMANHVSALDIWALFVALPIPVRMIAKKQLASIPLFGWAMWAGRFIFIDRQNAVAARRSIEAARQRIQGGQSVLLFPEGTRSRDGLLASFKKGGFHLAMDAGVPIVPVALRGSYQAMPPGSWLLRPRPVQVIIGAPIPTAGLTPADREALLTRVRGEIATMLESPAPRATG